MLKTNKFKQLINTPTRETKSSSSLIDHIWTNSSGKVSQSGVIESGVSDHFIIFCTRKITREHIGKHNNINIRSLKNYDQDTFRENLRGTDWSPVTSSFDSNVIWEIFSTIFNQKIDEVAPPKESRIKNRTEPWINNEILKLMHERDKFYITQIEIKQILNLEKTIINHEMKLQINAGKQKIVIFPTKLRNIKTT